MSNHGVILVNKPVGKTPLDMIHSLKRTDPHLANTPLGYAGRLDPMANGLLVILVGAKNNERKSFERFDKTYHCEALFGVETDTYDLLGKITKTALKNEVTRAACEAVLPRFVGKQEQPYPPYSSPRVKGHPLFWWARAGRLQEITIPTKTIQINALTIQSWREVNFGQLQEPVLGKLATISGEFRQEEIKAEWAHFLTQNASVKTVVAEFEVLCSSGTYIRSLIHELGHTLGTCATAYSITRTRVGPYLLPVGENDRHHD